VFNTLFTLRLGGREISLHTYGVLIAIGLAAGIALAYRQARRQGMDGGRVLDAAFWMIVAGLVGSRVVYGLVNAGEFARVCFHGGGMPRSAGAVLSDCTRILAIWQGGLVFYGGVAGAALVGYRFARREGWSFATFGDLFAPALALGHAFGRLGCFAAGCCFGKLGGGALATSFPRGSVAFDELASAGAIPPGWQTTPGLHPTQLYEAIGELLIFTSLLVLRPRVRRQPGTLLVAYLGLYALLRFVVEIFRGDVIRGLVFSLDTHRLAGWLHLPPKEPLFLSVGQLGSLIVLALCAVVWTRMRRNTVAVTPSAPPSPRLEDSTDVSDSTAAQMDRAAAKTDQRASVWADRDEPQDD
jgi:phosphatidylglycerol---prolipoprotein diacylglyceryl transferase